MRPRLNDGRRARRTTRVPDCKRSRPLILAPRIIEFVQNILRLERTVEALKKENKELTQRVKVLQEQVLAHEGELKVLLQFVQKALDSAIETRTKKIAIAVFETMAGKKKRYAKRRKQKDEA